LIRHVGKGRGEDAERCPQHNQEELSVYCDTCQACICSKCALFGQHVGHKHLPVDDVYKKHYHLLIADGNRLRKHLLAVASMGKKVDKSVERVRIERKNHEEIMKVALDQIMKRFEKTTNDKMRQLSEVREKLSESSDRIQLFMADLDEKMKTGSKKELVSQSSSLKQKLSHFLQGLDPLPVNDNELSKISSFTNEIVPPYDVKTVKIHNFSTLRRRGEVVYSDPLVVGGLTWRLKVYPDGSNNVKGKYLSVFVELSDGPTKTTRYEYRIEIIWQGSGGGKDVSKDLVREHASDFAVGESWGYNKFYKLDYLLPEGYIHPANDTLHFRFGVRCQTYHQKCRDLMLYVHRLKKEQNSMSRKIQDLEQVRIFRPFYNECLKCICSRPINICLLDTSQDNFRNHVKPQYW
jgi:tripartite motif-containing protein 37